LQQYFENVPHRGLSRYKDQLDDINKRATGLVAIVLEKGIIFYSPNLWRYIKTRASFGTIRELDKKLPARIRDYYGGIG